MFQDDYAAETKVLKKALKVERDAILASVTVGFVAFATIRYLPHVGIRIIGGESRLKALREAEIKAKNAPNARLKSLGSFLFESTIGFWASYRGYHLALNIKADDVYRDMVEIPLCPGRSTVSDVICKDWSKIVKYQIPKEFWTNLEKPSVTVENEAFFRAVLGFEEACSKRKRYEEIIRKRKALARENPIFIPEPGVPPNIFELSEEEIEFHSLKLVAR